MKARANQDQPSHQIPASARKRYLMALHTIRALMEVRGLNKPPVDLTKLSHALGIIRVEEKDITPDAMLLSSSGGYEIILKDNAYPTRMRFSWAHELAHLLLDRPNEGAAVFRNVDDKAIESLCDDLAAEILMPNAAFSAEVRQLGFGLLAVPQLAAHFCTSLEAAAIRLVKTSPSASVLSKWQSRKEIGPPRRSWDISSQPGIRVHFASGSDSRLQPIEDAFLYGGHASGKSLILVGRKSDTARSYKAEIQAFGFGAPSHRRVLSLTTW